MVILYYNDAFVLRVDIECIYSLCVRVTQKSMHRRVGAESTAPAHLKHNSSSLEKRGKFTRVHACVAKDVIW